MGRRKTKSEVR